MVKKSKFLCSLGVNTLILGFVAFVMVAHLFIKILQLDTLKNKECIYNEPIDIVYTWVNGSDQRFLDDMNKYLQVKNKDIDSSKRRFEDKNELRFSLRSLEKYAPWVNHVYLVTNGQIPYWLNLDYEKITVVTHEEIFKDKVNLPTFSSPAIESNLFRIPGLTKKFIYFNDDVFIGQPLYPDDFYSIHKGYNVFLDYNLPGCTKECPWLYVGDGQCDKACNIAKCQFDGGDCDKTKDMAIVYGDDSHEDVKTYNEKVNREFEILRQKVQKMFANGHTNEQSDVNSSISISNQNASISEDVIFTVKEKTEINSQNISVNNSNISFNMQKRSIDVSISKLVEEHNKKVLVQNKKISRRKRYLYRGKPVRDRGSRVLRSVVSVNGYLESLLYTQRLLNKKFGYKPRNVPAHAPILIDKDIMQNLQDAFSTEFELTEGNRFRNGNDVQFGFSYYYFLMSDTNPRSVNEVFDEFDTDMSGTWSDREIRNLLTKIYELPLSYEIVDHFEGILLNCSEFRTFPEVTPPLYERYIDSRLPTITKDIVTKCLFLSEYLQDKFGQVPKHKYEVCKDSDNQYVTFRMLFSNVTNVVMKLDEIRNKMTKFVCLNDDLDDSKPNENELVRAILYDFYLSLFPHPSQFELPENSRNRFLYMDELNDWKRHHYALKIVLCLSIVTMVFLTFFNMFRRGCCKIFGEFFN